MAEKLVRALEELTVKDVIDKEFKKLSPILESVYEDDKLKKEGKRIYSNWRINNFTWTLQDYGNESFQAVYVKKLFKNRARLTKNAMLEALKQIPRLRDVLVGVRTIQVASLGCGPGPELVGIQAFLQENLELDPSRVHLTGYDAVDTWKKYHDKLGTTFVVKTINERFLLNLPQVDIIITSYFASSANLSDHNPDDKSNWDLIISKCRVVIVIDMNDRHQRNSLKKRKFIEFSVYDEQRRQVFIHIKLNE